MFVRTSRNPASIVAWTIASTLAAVVMVSLAAAAPKVDKNQIQIDPQQEKVVAACGRTTGCSWNSNPQGGGWGCTSTGCFVCDGQTCYPAKAVLKGGPQPVGHPPVGRTGGVNSVPGASTAVRRVTQGATHQVAVQSSSTSSSSHKH